MSTLPGTLLEHYSLRPPLRFFPVGQGMNSQTVGVHTGSGDFLWKRYQPFHAEESIRYEHRLLGWLAKCSLSFAVAPPVATADGDTLWASDDGLYALFPFIPGEPADYTNPRQLENVGAGLAELHGALAGYPTAPRPEMSGFDALG
nr:phosphotransferase [Caldilineaceae bacterium]